MVNVSSLCGWLYNRLFGGVDDADRLTRHYFRGKRCCVTGGASGIGLQIVYQLLDGGAKVFVIDCNPDSLAKLIHTVNEHSTWESQQLGTLSIDLTQPEACPRSVTAAIEFLGQIDVLFNNAGVAVSGLISKTPAEKMIFQNRINMEVPMVLTQCVLEAMGKTTRTEPIDVAFTASIASFMHFPMSPTYCATKAGIRSFALSLQRGMVVAPWQFQFPVRCCTIFPGFVRTNLLPTDFFDQNMNLVNYEPKDVAKTLLNGIRQGKAEVFVTWGDRLSCLTDVYFPWLVTMDMKSKSSVEELVSMESSSVQRCLTK